MWVAKILCFDVQIIPSCNLVLHVVRRHSWASSLAHAKQYIFKFAFVCGRDKCSQTLGRITSALNYYLKDLNIEYSKVLIKVHHHIEDNTWFINDKPNKVIWNSWYNCVFLELLSAWFLSRCNIQYKSWMLRPPSN